MSEESQERLKQTIDEENKRYKTMQEDPIKKLPAQAGLQLAGNKCKTQTESMLNSNTTDDLRESMITAYRLVTEELSGYLDAVRSLRIINNEDFQFLLNYYTIHVANEWLYAMRKD